jgi:hypothetical protein
MIAGKAGRFLAAFPALFRPGELPHHPAQSGFAHQPTPSALAGSGADHAMQCACFPWHSMAITKPVYAEFIEALEARYPNTTDRNPG